MPLPFVRRLALALLTLTSLVTAAAALTSPKEHFGFAIGDDSEVGDFVEVGPDNLRMSLFLLWLMAEEQTTAFAGAFQAKTTEKHREKAGTFFDHHTCVEARKPVGISHPNLRRFLSRGSVVTIYFADPT